MKFLDMLSVFVLFFVVIYAFSGNTRSEYAINEKPSFQVDIRPIMVESCYYCHAEKGLLDFTEYVSAYGYRFSIVRKVTLEQTMPKHGNMLRTSERDLIKLWVDTGAGL